MSYQAPIAVNGIWLVREGEYIVVKVERDGLWIEVIREHTPVAKPAGWSRG